MSMYEYMNDIAFHSVVLLLYCIPLEELIIPPTKVVSYFLMGPIGAYSELLLGDEAWNQFWTQFCMSHASLCFYTFNRMMVRKLFQLHCVLFWEEDMCSYSKEKTGVLTVTNYHTTRRQIYYVSSIKSTVSTGSAYKELINKGNKQCSF